MEDLFSLEEYFDLELEDFKVMSLLHLSLLHISSSSDRTMERGGVKCL